MTDLYYRPHLRETPGPLPFSAMTINDEPPQARTDLANHPASVEECGFVLAPPRPAETDAQAAAWDHDAEAWIMVDRPPPPPPAPLPKISIPNGVFLARLLDEEGDPLDTAMRKKPFRIRAAWIAVADRGEPIYEDETLSPLWTPLRAEIVAQFGEERAAAILARFDGGAGAVLADEPIAA